ncbi:MAG: hypothetical protein KF708_22515 [Pirellulales bacterium]|nr:hypothetical protein [Pirellulales bacterium]
MASESSHPDRPAVEYTLEAFGPSLRTWVIFEHANNRRRLVDVFDSPEQALREFPTARRIDQAATQ